MCWEEGNRTNKPSVIRHADRNRSAALARGTSVMVACVTAAKLLGLVYLFPLTRLIHDEGIGIYANAYSLYVILLTLSTAGFPTALGKLLAERLALGRADEVEAMYRVTLRTVTRFGLLLCLAMWWGAPFYSHLVALRASNEADAALTGSIHALAPALLVVPLMSALRGYLQGFQKLEPSAFSQAVEQLVRVLAIVVGAFVVMHRGGTPAEGAAAATFGAFIGALAGLIWLLAAVAPVRRRFRQRYQPQPARTSARELRRELWRVALPVSLGALVVPVSGLVDALTVQNALLFAGFSFTAATQMYGILSRQAMQLVQLPLAFAMAVGASVLPAVAEAKALRDPLLIAERIRHTLRSLLFLTLPAAAAMLVLNRPLDQLLFGSTEGASVIASVSLMSVLCSLELTSTYVLQGLGKMYRPVRNMFLGVLVKLICNLLLIIPFHILGAAAATTIGYLVSATLNVLAVKKYGELRGSVWRLALPALLATIPLCGVLAGGQWLGAKTAVLIHLPPDAAAALELTLALAPGAAVYLTAAVRFGAVSPEELRPLPAVGRRLARWAERWVPAPAAASRLR